MNLKTYRAATMAQALAEVKNDLGKDAVILHTRTYRVGAVMGIGGKPMVEITASDSPAAAGPRLRQSMPAPPATTPARTAQPATQERPTPSQAATPAAATPAPPGAYVEAKKFDLPSFDAPRAVQEKFEPAREGDRGGVRPSAPRDQQVEPAARPRAAALVSKAEIAPVDAGAAESLREELASIRNLVGQVLRATRETAATVSASPAAAVLSLGGMPEPLFECYLSLQKAGLAPESAERVLAAARESLTAAELGDRSSVRQAVVAELAGLLRTIGAATPAKRQPDGRPLVVALVGPTGVGKTTTIAKLAAMYKLRHGKRVGLITADTYRIAAVDQLRTYANIIGLPLKVATTPGDVAVGLAELDDQDVVLLDTAGRSHADAARLTELAAVLGAAAPHETHLVLCAAAAETAMSAALRRFALLRPDRLVFSKLDEAEALGCLPNLVALPEAASLRLSYVTTGQEVPDQIELADARKLARRILDGPVIPEQAGSAMVADGAEQG